MNEIDLNKVTLRELNSKLQNSIENENWLVTNPKGNHALAVGLDNFINVKIDGSTGYYCAGMNKKASIQVNGSVGPGAAENMMSGKLIVEGNASQYAGATGHGGSLIIKGNASSRCGISMKGIDIIIKGNIGHMSAFMAQSGKLIVCGDVGDSLGDSIYEAQIFVKGSVRSLGSDCIEKEMSTKHKQLLEKLLDESKINFKASKFKRYGSARKLYNFDIDNLSKY
tara:strand:+ start:351 stop:1025 length:675 start_codon:yes stop_codon:yes gene_type:complete